ncbi:MAG: ornithine carbamoyltransferase [Candidatus Schekmanbacteria bacterium]|nr:MAG: ornithine carbamoyltransferase [Candidatus Schekmanbacteria bacterium]
MQKKDLLSLADLSRREICELIDRAKILKQWKSQGIVHKPLEGKTLGLIFNKPSTRTRVTFEVGMYQLGGTSLFLSEKEIQLGRGETVADTAKVLSRYVDGVVMRTFKQSDLEEFAQEATCPLINGLTDSFHPCQILADIMTIEEAIGRIEGTKVAYVGDFNNVANSLILGALLMGYHITVACPKECEASDELKSKIEIVEKREESSGTYEVIDDPIEAVKDADIIYTDVWISMGQEKERDKKLKLFSPYQVNKELVSKSKEGVKIMHCLPAHRGEEITSDVLDSENSIVFDQAENRLHIQKAILEYLLSGSKWNFAIT